MTSLEDLTPEYREIAEELEQRRASSGRSRWLTIGVFVFAGLTVAAFLASGLMAFANKAANAANAGDISAIRQDLKTVCRQADTATLPTSEQDKCFRAEANLPPQSAPTTSAAAQPQPARDGVTPSDDQLLILIRGVIASNPPKDGHTPTPEELLALIRPLIPNPVAGEPGATPTDAQLLVLIRGVYAANPPRNAHCFDVPEDPACQPKDGTDGTNGRDAPKPNGAASFARIDGVCTYVVPYTDGSTVTAATQDALCDKGSEPPPILPTN